MTAVDTGTRGGRAGSGLRRFGAIWLGQLVSLVGSALSTFVLGVWVYQGTGSVTQFALIAFCAVLPGILVAPLAGVAADRLDRRRIMMAADVGAGLATAAIALLVATDALAVWHVYLAAAFAAACNAFHLVAFNALIPAVVGKRHLSRVNGFMQITQAVQIAAPLIAAALLALVGLLGVILIDLVSMAVAISTLLLTRLPASATRPVGADAAPASVRTDIAVGARYLWQRPALLGLVAVFGAFNFVFGLAGALVQPLILSFSGPSVLGLLMFAGGSGLLAGSLVMTVWGGPRRRIDGIYLGLMLGGLALVAHSLRPSPWLIAVAAPMMLFTLPLLNTMSMTLLQTKVAPAVLGRVVATVRMISTSALPVAYLLAGPLADGIFEPAMAPGGWLAPSAGVLIGTGEGRGIALVFLLIGLLLLLVAAVARANTTLRHIDELPDELPDEPDGSSESEREVAR
jgi:MFS transporter, DHA3 family, macrolide efflux protein